MAKKNFAERTKVFKSGYKYPSGERKRDIDNVAKDECEEVFKETHI